MYERQDVTHENEWTGRGVYTEIAQYPIAIEKKDKCDDSKL